MQWDTTQWLRRWAVAATPSARSRLLEEVMLSNDDEQSVASQSPPSSRPFDVSVQLLNVLQHHHKRNTACVPFCGATVYPAELPVTPMKAPTALGFAATSTGERNAPHCAPHCELLFVFRDVSQSSLEASMVVSLQGRSESSMLHTSARVMMQTDLCLRARWGYAYFQKAPQNCERFATSTTSIVEAHFHADLLWCRHGVERGFEAMSAAGVEGTCPVDAVVVSFASTASRMDADKCVERLRQILDLSVGLCMARHPGTVCLLVVDVGADMEHATDVAKTFKTCVLKAAHLLTAQDRLKVVSSHPATSAAQRANSMPQAASFSVLPATEGCTIAPQVVSAPGAVNEMLQPLVRRAVDLPTSSDDEDEPLWKTYTQTSKVSRPAAAHKHGNNASAKSKLPSKKLLAAESVIVANSNLESRREGGAQHQQPNPLVDVLFVEVPRGDVKRFKHSASLRSSIAAWFNAPLAALAAACEGKPSELPSTSDVLLSWLERSNSGALCMSPFRAVVFLCAADHQLNPLLLSWCSELHEEYASMPLLLAAAEGELEQLAPVESSLGFLNNACDFEDDEAESDRCNRLSRLLQAISKRMRVNWGGSLFMATTEDADKWCGSDALRALLYEDNPEKAGPMSHIRCAHMLEMHKEDAICLPASILATLATPPACWGVSCSAAGAWRSAAVEMKDKVRRRYAEATAHVFGRHCVDLVRRPRRPEVSVGIDRPSKMRLGVVRPPALQKSLCGVVVKAIQQTAASSDMAMRSAMTVDPNLVRFGAQERDLIVSAIRLIFCEEFRVAMDVLTQWRLREAKGVRGRKFPYFAGFAAVCLGVNHVRLSSVVRRNIFTEAELAMKSVVSTREALKKASEEATAGTSDGPHTVALLELLLPFSSCSCAPRPGERCARVTQSGRKRRKLCRHMAQVVLEFLDAQVPQPSCNSIASAAASPPVRGLHDLGGGDSSRILAAAPRVAGDGVPRESHQPADQRKRPRDAQVIDFAAQLMMPGPT